MNNYVCMCNNLYVEIKNSIEASHMQQYCHNIVVKTSKKIMKYKKKSSVFLIMGLTVCIVFKIKQIPV